MNGRNVSLFHFSFQQKSLAHLVLANTCAGPVGVFRIQLVLDLDVKVATVLLIRAADQRAVHLFTLLDCEHVLEVEHRLLPVSVFCVWASREGNGLVACREFNVKPSHKSVNEVVAAGSQVKWYAVGQVGNSALVQVEGEDTCGVGNNGLHLDGVDEGLGEGSCLERGVVETVNIVPD